MSSRALDRARSALDRAALDWVGREVRCKYAARRLRAAASALRQAATALDVEADACERPGLVPAPAAQPFSVKLQNRRR
jgi:hypothetical protein